MKKKTIRESLSFEGVGLHTGVPCRLHVHPNLKGDGIFFLRKGGEDALRLRALHPYVYSTQLCTELRVNEFSISTIEHVLSVCQGLEIWDLLVECEGPEVPILDGSALLFLQAIEKVGFQELEGEVEVWPLVEPLRQSFSHGAFFEVFPYPCLQIEYHIDFESESSSIGQQSFFYAQSPDSFRKELAFARTFCLEDQVEPLKSQGLIRGGSLENAVVYGAHGVLNPEGARVFDECVRHKILDLLGDLCLLGTPVAAYIRVSKGGHQLHLELVRALAEQLKRRKVLGEDFSVHARSVNS